MGKSGGNAPPDSELSRIAGPWLPLQQPARAGISELQQFRRETDPYQYGPSIATPFNMFQNAGLMGSANLASQGTGAFGDYFNALQNYAGGQGSRPGNQFLTQLSQGQYNDPATSAYKNIYGRAASGDLSDQAFTTLKNFAEGDYVGKNPYLDATYGQGAKALRENFQESVNPTIEGLLTRTGGGGGSVEALLKGQAQRELGTSLEDLSTKIYGGAYDSDMSRMFGAAQALPGAENTRINTLLQGAGGISDANQRNIATRLQGVGGLQTNQQNQFLQMLQAGGQLGTAYQNQFTPYNILNQVGGAYQTQQERLNAEAQDKFRYGQDARYQDIMRYAQGLGAFSALAPNSGAVAASYAQNAQSQPSAFQQFLGNVTGIAGAAAPIIGSFYGPGGYLAGQAASRVLSGGTGTDTLDLTGYFR